MDIVNQIQPCFSPHIAAANNYSSDPGLMENDVCRFVVPNSTGNTCSKYTVNGEICAWAGVFGVFHYYSFILKISPL